MPLATRSANFDAAWESTIASVGTLTPNRSGRRWPPSSPPAPPPPFLGGYASTYTRSLAAPSQYNRTTMSRVSPREASAVSRLLLQFESRCAAVLASCFPDGIIVRSPDPAAAAAAAAVAAEASEVLVGDDEEGFDETTMIGWPDGPTTGTFRRARRMIIALGSSDRRFRPAASLLSSSPVRPLLLLCPSPKCST
ncbi:unnamed protein product [Ectocarpus fasciculatus]